MKKASQSYDALFQDKITEITEILSLKTTLNCFSKWK
jgi:hypothetical protein